MSQILGICIVVFGLVLADAPIPIVHPVLAMEPQVAPSTVQLSIIYEDSTIVPVEVSASVPDTTAPREIIFRAWKNGSITSAHYVPDSSGVIVARIIHSGAK